MCQVGDCTLHCIMLYDARNHFTKYNSLLVPNRELENIGYPSAYWLICMFKTVSKCNAAGTKTALNELYSAISKQENVHPEEALLVAGNFNAGKLKSVLPNFNQHVKCATRGENTLDHHYSTHRDTYKALPHTPFGKSDHNSFLLISAYKLK